MKINISEFHSSGLFKPIRTRMDVILLVLKTMEITLTTSIEKDTGYKLVFKKNKKGHYRAFYISENKTFSIYFPFLINQLMDSTLSFQYSTFQNIKNLEYLNIDLQKISFIIEWVNKINNLEGLLFDNLFEIIYPEDDQDEATLYLDKAEKDYCIEILFFLLQYDEGYLRYENDIKNENGRKHPRYHFDIFFEEKSSFKIGLENAIPYSDFELFLDNDLDRWFVNK